MKDNERSRIVRQGEGAASRQDAWTANPFLDRANMPAATGESLQDWGERHDAWQQGFEGRPDAEGAGPDGKTPMSAPALQAICERHIAELPAIRHALERAPADRLVVGLPERHPRDAQGRNWALDDVRCGDAPAWTWEPQLHEVLDGLRRRFDLV